jgi:diaminopropionate ammonia-lyase
VSAPSDVLLAPHVRAGDAPRGLFSDAEWRAQREYFAARPTLAPTPLRAAPALARRLGLGGLWLKDETSRFDLPAFKGLGAGFAIARLRAEGRLPVGTTLVCASEGNHGRAVARAAREQGLACRVYVGARVAAARAEAIASEGATVVRVEGTYDDAVRVAAFDAEREGWTVISDTAWPGYLEVPHLIMLGYTRLMDECAAQWGTSPPDVVVVQGGVGGLAAAVGSWWAARDGATRPRLVCVEPRNAPCLLESARAGHPVPVVGPLDTIMGGLRCGEVSPPAYAAVAEIYDAFLAIDDEWVRAAMRLLARPADSDPCIRCGPSGAAGVGALLALREEPALLPVCDALGLGPGTTVLALITEGVTEPHLFDEVLAE